MRLRLFDFDDHVGAGEDIRRGRQHAPAGLLIGRIVEANAETRALLDHDLMAVMDKLAHAAGDEPDAIFVGLNFLRNADQHVFSTSRSRPNISSICDFSTISGGDSARMSPVWRTSKPRSKHLI